MEFLEIVVGIATVIGTAVVVTPVINRWVQWLRSKIDSQRAIEGGQDSVMLSSPSTMPGVKITVVVPTDDHERLDAVVTKVLRLTLDRCPTPIQQVEVTVVPAGESDETP